MSTLTKEWLLKTIAELEEERDATPGAVNEDAARAMEAMKIALASLEADVVAWTDEQELRDVEKYGCGYLFTANPVTPNADPHRVIKLYTAPPAPVSVPDLLEQFAEFMAAESIKSGDYPDGWQSKASNATHEYAQNIRAAMLQGAELVKAANKFPANVIDALEKALQAMSFMGDTLNALDAVCEEDVEYVTPAFESVRKVLESNSSVIPDGVCPCCGRKPLKNRTCSVSGCDGKHVARGFCIKHYAIERKKDPSRRESIRAADKRYRARKAAAPQQEVK
ncbi:hypothetical protein ACS6IV_05310 [Enterobacter hormaechei subsp. xiangfangensis]|uniref:hypothetical protein n=1 Tax=Enterobacter hormaechei TaxID=158836 RepID=UPI003860E81D